MMKKNIVILGGGESGYGSAYLAKQQGYNVFLSDRGTLKNRYREALKKSEIDFEEGQHTIEKIVSADEIIKSPGLPESAEIMKLVRAKGIHVISEIEFAGRFSKAKTICVTGSNGKTTITSLVYDMLKRGGFNVGVGGNIGDSYAYQVATEKHDWYVLELSSFQLDDMFDFKADISLISNITPDHLDRYDYKMANYVEAKFRVIQNQTTSEDNFVCNLDDPETISYLKNKFTSDVSLVGLSSKDEKQQNFFDDKTGLLRLNIKGKNIKLNISNRKCKGVHNASNYAQGAVASLLAGVSVEAVQESINEFQGIEHRVENVGVFGDVQYINDSKATNIDAVWYALESIKQPTVWIAGGKDKGNDYSLLYDVISNVHTLVCMGLDNEKLQKAFAGRIPNIISTNTLNDAMKVSVSSAKKGDVVLLSPACASFDLFKSYEDRGRQFKDYIQNNIK